MNTDLRTLNREVRAVRHGQNGTYWTEAWADLRTSGLATEDDYGLCLLAWRSGWSSRMVESLAAHWRQHAQ